MAAAMHLVAQIDVESMITQELPFDSAPNAYALIDSSPADVLAVLLDYEREGS